MDLTRVKTAVITGSNHGIGQALVKRLLQMDTITNLFATYRISEKSDQLTRLVATDKRLHPFKLDACDESQFQQLANSIRQESSQIDLLINCIGYLEEGPHAPEKRLSQVETKHMLRSFQVNSLTPLFLAKHLFDLFRNPNQAAFCSLSARVGSIEDNRSGGWYAYRTSKAAHNMITRNIALEYERMHCNTIVLALHPGTTKTPLSEKFITKNTPYTVHSADATASNLLEVIQKRSMADSGKFFDWRGEQLPF